MALKAAEAHALRRAFDVTGLPAIDEQRPYDEHEQPRGGLGAVLSQTSGAEDAPDAARASDERPDSSAPESPLLNTRSNLAKAMYAAINEAGITKDETPGLYRQVTGRDVESSKELTDDEARAVLAHLDAMKDQPIDGELVEP
jgi:hypothetical protein